MEQTDYAKAYLEASHGHLTAEDLEGTPMVDLHTGLFSTPFFFKRLGEEILRAERYRHFLSVILIHADARLPNNTRKAAAELRRIGKGLTGILSRRTDFQALFGRKQIAVLLPETDKGGAASVLERFHVQLEGGNAKLTYATLSFPEDASNLKILYRHLENLSEALIRGVGEDSLPHKE